ncbi:MAG: class I SAM-dependent RNA methyltransferase [Syntrophaceae bacterium]|nr:class I SAM-dependent RNA methyltransferase [Syntrophaceae bacterium]
MQVKNRVNIEIESVAFGGDGVGRVDNFVVFVPFSAPGDKLEIEIVQRKKKFARGKILKVIKSSEASVKPLCRYYENCGGCCYQHINYESQLAIKKKQVVDAFEKIGGIAAPPVREVIASPQMYHYRGKAQLHAFKKAGGVKFGFMDVSGGKVVDIERCEIVDETINEKIHALRASQAGAHGAEDKHTIWSGKSSGGKESKETITRVVKSKEFLVPREGFFQANLYITDNMVDEVCNAVKNEKISTLIDAYCGSGLFSVFLSPYAENIIGIEQDASSVECAKINALKSGAKNLNFFQGDVEELRLGRFLSPEHKTDMMLLDPPRIGCSPSVLKSICSIRPRKIIYISCNPATQARDVKYLREQGYNLQNLHPMDMFPQTQHIEVIGILEEIR